MTLIGYRSIFRKFMYLAWPLSGPAECMQGIAGQLRGKVAGRNVRRLCIRQIEITDAALRHEQCPGVKVCLVGKAFIVVSTEADSHR